MRQQLSLICFSNMEINFCFSTEAKRWIKFRSSCSDRCRSFDSFLWITSEWINLEVVLMRCLGYLCPTCIGGELGIWQHQHCASSSSLLLQPGPSHSYPAPVKSWGPSLPCWALAIFRAPTSICKVSWKLPGDLILLLGEGERSGLVLRDLSHLICLSLLHGYRLPRTQFSIFSQK